MNGVYDLPAHESHAVRDRCIKFCVTEPELIHMAGQEGLLRVIKRDWAISVGQALSVEEVLDTLMHGLRNHKFIPRSL